MKPMYVYDKLNGDKKEVALISYVEGFALLWTNTKGARVTTERDFSQIEALEGDCIHCNGKGFNGLSYCPQCNQLEVDSE